MAEGKSDTDTGSDQGTSTDTKTGEKTFTQEQVNRIVSQRVNETKNQFSGYDEFRNKAQVLDNMMDDNRFQTFLSSLSSDKETAAKTSAQSSARTSDGPIALTEMPEFQEMKRLDPEMASAFAGVATKLVENVRQSVSADIVQATRPFQNEIDMEKARRATEQVKSMEEDTENYPAMQSPEFKSTMASMLTGNPGQGVHPRASRLEDAYDLAALQWEREGRELPSSPSKTSKAKGEAELLEDRGGHGSGDTEEQEAPPKFKDAREAVEYNMKKMGWV